MTLSMSNISDERLELAEHLDLIRAKFDSNHEHQS
jgi:hypothetical protein